MSLYVGVDDLLLQNHLPILKNLLDMYEKAPHYHELSKTQKGEVKQHKRNLTKNFLRLKKKILAKNLKVESHQLDLKVRNFKYTPTTTKETVLLDINSLLLRLKHQTATKDLNLLGIKYINLRKQIVHSKDYQQPTKKILLLISERLPMPLTQLDNQSNYKVKEVHRNYEELKGIEEVVIVQQHYLRQIKKARGITSKSKYDVINKLLQAPQQDNKIEKALRDYSKLVKIKIKNKIDMELATIEEQYQDFLRLTKALQKPISNPKGKIS